MKTAFLSASPISLSIRSHVVYGCRYRALVSVSRRPTQQTDRRVHYFPPFLLPLFLLVSLGRFRRFVTNGLLTRASSLTPPTPQKQKQKQESKTSPSPLLLRKPIIIIIFRAGMEEGEEGKEEEKKEYCTM